MRKHNPDVVIFDISPPYDENWQFFKTMRDADVMRGRGSVLTITNKNRVATEKSVPVAVIDVAADHGYAFQPWSLSCSRSCGPSRLP
jgi:hypothetical protein